MQNANGHMQCMHIEQTYDRGLACHYQSRLNIEIQFDNNKRFMTFVRIECPTASGSLYDPQVYMEIRVIFIFPRPYKFVTQLCRRSFIGITNA